jgi:hypothetical protein
MSFGNQTTTELIVGTCVLCGSLLLVPAPIIAFLLFVIAGLFIFGGFRQVPANPPMVAVPTVWGTRQQSIIRERIVLVWPHFPIFEQLIFIGATRQARTFDLKEIRCAAMLAASDKSKSQMIGGSVSAKVGVVFQPDLDNPGGMIDYLNAGGKGWPPLRHDDEEHVCVDEEAEKRHDPDPVWKQLEITVMGTLRQEAGHRTWAAMVHSKAELSAMLVTRITGQPPSMRVVRNANGIPVPDLDPHTKYEFKREPITPGYELTEDDYSLFLTQININGAKDVRGLGIVIRSITVEEVEPEGKLKQDAEESDREASQRDAEKLDFETEEILADRYVEKAKNRGETIPYKEALKYVRINRNRAEEVVVNTDDAMLGAGALFRGRQNRNDNRRDSANNKGPDSKQ